MDSIILLPEKSWLRNLKCVSPVLFEWVSVADDKGGRYVHDRLKLLAPKLADTKVNDPDSRVWKLVDYAVRVSSPVALEAIGLIDETTRLRELSEVTVDNVDDVIIIVDTAAARAVYTTVYNAVNAARVASVNVKRNAICAAAFAAYAVYDSANAVTDIASHVSGTQVWDAALDAFEATI